MAVNDKRNIKHGFKTKAGKKPSYNAQFVELLWKGVGLERFI